MCGENRTYCCCAAEICCAIVDFMVRQGLPGQYCDNGRRGKSMDEADDSYIKERNARARFSLVRDAEGKKCGLRTILYNPTSICFPFCKLAGCLQVLPYSRNKDRTGAAAVRVSMIVDISMTVDGLSLDANKASQCWPPEMYRIYKSSYA